MRFYSLSEVGEKIEILREKYYSYYQDVLDKDQELASVYLKKMKKCEDAIEILEILAYKDVMESFSNLKSRVLND